MYSLFRQESERELLDVQRRHRRLFSCASRILFAWALSAQWKVWCAGRDAVLAFFNRLIGSSRQRA